VEVLSIERSVDSERVASMDKKPVEIEIAYSSRKREVVLQALGPMLGSMDSPEVKTAIDCTRQGVVVTGTITRSADFNGAALQNQIWRPRITIVVNLLRPDVVFQTTWKLRLTTGVPVGQARTPPYPEQRYPITVTRRFNYLSSRERAW
jgi:hypothetical protein